jgi:DUF917 family protein
MSRIVRGQELHDIVIGAAFLGSGGGGSPKDGLRLLDELKSLNKAEVTMLKCQEMGDDEWAVMVAEIGSPKAFAEAESFPETVTAFELMQKTVAQSGQNLKYLMAGELGGFNTMVPLYVAALKEVPFVDADGQGRAVPELSTSLYATGDIPTYPLIMAGSNGDSVVVYLNDPLDSHAAENIARYVSTAYGQLAAFCTWVVDREMITDKLVPDSITLCMTIGKAFREAKGIQELSKTLAEKVGVKELFLGTISNIELKSEGGFDFGITTIEGTDAYAGKSAAISFKNENILIRDETGKVIGTVPDLIIVVNLDPLEPLTNADTEVGQKVAVFGATAPASWFKSPMGFGCWKHILDKLDYTGDYVPVK